MADIYGRPDRDQFLPEGATQLMQKHALKAVACALFLVSTLMLIAIFTYDISDPSFNQVHSQHLDIQNGAGQFGAYLADLLLQSLGLGALILTAAICALGCCCWKQKVPNSAIVSAIPAISLSSALAISFFPNFFASTQTGAGGVLGDLLPHLLQTVFGSIFGSVLSIMLSLLAAFATGKLGLFMWRFIFEPQKKGQGLKEKTFPRQPYEAESILKSVVNIGFVTLLNSFHRLKFLSQTFKKNQIVAETAPITPDEFFNVHSFSANRFEDLQPPVWTNVVPPQEQSVSSFDTQTTAPNITLSGCPEKEEGVFFEPTISQEEVKPEYQEALSQNLETIEPSETLSVLDISSLETPQDLPPTQEFVTPATHRPRAQTTEALAEGRRRFMILDALSHEPACYTPDTHEVAQNDLSPLPENDDNQTTLSPSQPSEIDFPVRPQGSVECETVIPSPSDPFSEETILTPDSIMQARDWLDRKIELQFQDSEIQAQDSRILAEETATSESLAPEISSEVSNETLDDVLDEAPLEFDETDFAAAVNDIDFDMPDIVEDSVSPPQVTDKINTHSISEHVPSHNQVSPYRTPILPPVAARPVAAQPIYTEETPHHVSQTQEPTPSPMAHPIAETPPAIPATPKVMPSATATQILPEYEFPPLTLLRQKTEDEFFAAEDEKVLTDRARQLESVLADFGIKGEIVKVRPGPVVTLYELEPAPGTKSSRVIGLSDDIARSMSAVSVRIAVVPGRTVIGIELPNPKRELVRFRELLECDHLGEEKSKLPLILGKDIGGAPIIADLAKMPHLLVAGTTGSGKSVAINTMILSLLYHLPPEKCRFIMVDPKMLELSVYNDIPHLLSPVVTDPRKAVVALKWAVREMEDRYKRMSMLNVRNIENYNMRMKEAQSHGEVLMRKIQTGFDPETGRPVYEEQPLPLEELPYIVIVVDEMADLMLVAGKDIEAAIQRLAQMARAAGIHIIMATQRPSVDVITGTIKANFPTRISFQVTSKIDSRTIIGEPSAETLLGQGDMLYMAGGGRLLRVHGPFVSDQEVENVVDHLKAQGVPDYIDNVTFEDDLDEGATNISTEDKVDELYDQAVALVIRQQKASTSFVQRQLQIGYNRAARLIERMEAEKIISPANQAGKRDVLVENDQFEE